MGHSESYDGCIAMSFDAFMLIKEDIESYFEEVEFIGATEDPSEDDQIEINSWGKHPNVHEIFKRIAFFMEPKTFGELESIGEDNERWMTFFRGPTDSDPYGAWTEEGVEIIYPPDPFKGG